MTDHHANHRRQDDQRIAEVIQIEVKQALREHFSVKKNGDTWGEYLGKIITPDRIIMLAILIYTVGGQVQGFKSDMSDLNAQQELLKEQQEVVAARLKAANDLFETQERVQQEQSATIDGLRGEVDTLMAENDKLRVLSGRLSDQLRGSVTRSEFNETIRQQLLPRLERIERTIGSK